MSSRTSRVRGPRASRCRPKTRATAEDIAGTSRGADLLVGWSTTTPKACIGFGRAPRPPHAAFTPEPILAGPEGHLITIAPTGAGKGVGCIIPALLSYDGPVVVIDPKGENVAVTARWRRSMGHQVIVLDPMGTTGLEGAALNPLQHIDPAAPSAVDDVTAIAHTLIERGADDRNRFWYDRGVHFLIGAILHTVADFPKERRTLRTVREVLAIGASGSDEFAARLRRSRHPEVKAIGASLDVTAKETRGAIFSIAQDGVDFAKGPLVQAATATTSFDLLDVTRGVPLSIYLVLPPHMLESHGKLLRLWIGTLMNAITARRRQPEKHTLFILDEASQLGELPQLRQAVTLLRGYGLRTWSFWQDVSQLRLRYPRDWQTMINNSAVLQCFGAFGALARGDLADLVGPAFSGRCDAGDADLWLRIRGGSAIRATRPDYRADVGLTGRFDANPYYDDGAMVRPSAHRPLLTPPPVSVRSAESSQTRGLAPHHALLLEHLLLGWV